ATERKQAGGVVEQLVVITHPDPVVLEARTIQDVSTPHGSVALGYYYDGHVLARGVVANDALDAIQGLLRTPVSVALAATEDESGNIEARVCLVLPVEPDELPGADEEPEEPWRASLPTPPGELNSEYEETPKLALLPIGNAVRGAGHRNHPDVAGDAKEMLSNLLSGRSHDAISRAIDDLLDSL
ncbi:MAG: hypothetical protein ACRELT_07185, partial [Longimicrobiales bacterium]